MQEIETERRFLLKRLPDMEYDKVLNIFQNYLSSKKDDITERIRMTIKHVGSDKQSNVFHHTTKERISDMSVIEKEKKISKKKFNELHQLSKRELSKTRYIFLVGDLKWEIDVFVDYKLIIAEIELPSEDYELVLPKALKKELIMEITGMKKFSNSNLAE